MPFLIFLPATFTGLLEKSFATPSQVPSHFSVTVTALFAKLFSSKPVKVAGKKVKKGTLLAKAAYGFTAPGTKKVKLKANKRGVKVLKKSKTALLKAAGAKKIVRVKK